MVFISAGHNPKGVKVDPGAVANGLREADLTVEFRNLVAARLVAKGAKTVLDNDTETLGEYLKRIKPGTASVVLEFHFDAAVNPKATGATCIVSFDADKNDKNFAVELAYTTATTLGIKNRGVISEADSHRGRLGLMREAGIVALLELCFISNPDDVKAYNANKNVLAGQIADIVMKYENLIL